MAEENFRATLSAHKDTNRVTYEDLRLIPAPAGTQYWRPVPHVVLVDAIRNELNAVGFEIVKEDFAVSNNGLKLFGTFDLASELAEGVAQAFGFRHANDKRIALQGVAGGRVFVCDNMMLSGDLILFRRKHVWNFDISDMVRDGIKIWQGGQDDFRDSLNRMQNTPLTDEQAQALLAKSLYRGVTTFQTFKLAYDLYFERAVAQPELYPDCAPRSAWGLHNAFTRALKEATPNVAFNTTIAISRELGLHK